MRGRGAAFRVWAPYAGAMAVRLFSGKPRTVRMKKGGGGYWEVFVPGTRPGALYKYLIDGADERPDPASAFQPQGVHGPSEVTDHSSFKWDDRAWKGIPPEKMIIYELHPGTFTAGGGFAGVEEKLTYLKDLGINAVELMPVAQFPGNRNWGYDGAYPYAVQNSYGGPKGLKKLVNACHKAGLAVVLDVVYNHLGPEGNYLECFGPYFTDRYRTPWGKAINYDGPDSGPVRDFFIGNALYWFGNFHIDALRLDAVHGIFDLGAKHILAELAEKTAEFSRQAGREFRLIAESDLNDTRLVKPPREGGHGLDAQWSDDFHHALHTLLTGERQGYYEDFDGFTSMARAFSDSFVYDWAWSAHRRRMHGSPAAGIAPGKFVVCSQNHDQVGNRLLGERLSSLAGFKRRKLAAGAVLLSPYIPMLFMGEEYGETNPFLYFVSHGDENLIKAVREGRKKEFAAFGWKADPPDPQSPEVFIKSRLDWDKPGKRRHAGMLAFYKSLIALRRAEPSLGPVNRADLVVRAMADNKTISLFRRRGRSATFTIFNFGAKPASRALPPGQWKQLFDSKNPSAAPRSSERTALPPESFKVFRRTAL
ncbi:MAG: malto-oligosyltrehalose trehalohydrolase [Elusimicrobia bacterium]|nr:malto-oligosyltrehalose trehalohydrolase [Elusimicrobiota bacterium]